MSRQVCNVCVCERGREREGGREEEIDIYVNWLLFIRFRKYRIVNRISILLNLQRVVAIHLWRDQSRPMGSARFGLQSPSPVLSPIWPGVAIQRGDWAVHLSGCGGFVIIAKHLYEGGGFRCSSALYLFYIVYYWFICSGHTKCFHTHSSILINLK